MKGKGGKQEEMDKGQGQTIPYLNNLARQAAAHIVNHDYKSATHPLADELKAFSQV